jgi:hypothetical protein
VRDDIIRKALEAVDFSPRRLPRSEVGGQPVACRREGLQKLVAGSLLPT